MQIHLDRTGSPTALRALLAEVLARDAVTGALVLACDSNGFAPADVDVALLQASKPVFGGIFPGIIHGREKLSRGSIVAGLTCPVRTFTVEGLSDDTTVLDDQLDHLIPDLGDAKTMFVLVDGYARCLSGLIEGLFNTFGLELNYIGGGAGSINPARLDMSLRPCLFTNQGLRKDCAVLALVHAESGVGVRHGWSHHVSGPHKVTESEGNAIRSLDWMPAFGVYRSIVEEHAHTRITPDNFFEVAKGYPFAITRLDSERIVRDPFTVDEQERLVVATEIPRESFVDILTGDADSLIEAARASRRDAEAAYAGQDQRVVLFMDCISRVLYLGERFREELDAVAIQDVPLLGALTLGEIANSGGDYLELYNKTCVVGILEDGA